MNGILNSYGYHASNQDIKQFLGMGRKAKLPNNHMSTAVVMIQGWAVVIDPPSDRKVRRGGANHRVRALCPVCSRWISAGRTAQHAKVHP